MFKKKSKIISLIVSCIFVCMLLTGCEGEPAKMKVTSGKAEIKNLISKEVWDGESPKAVNPFQVYAKKNKELVSLKTGDVICMEFVNLSGGEPETVELSIYALNADGTFVDGNAEPQKVEVEMKDEKVKFEVPEYSDEAEAYGYDLRCVWGEDICRYNFMVK